jgi:hypothetical protein
MGSLALTNPGLAYSDASGAIDPNTGLPVQAMPHVKFFKNQQAAMDQANKALQSVPAPALSVMPPQVTAAADGGQDANGQPLPPALNFGGGGASLDQPQTNLPRFFKPSFSQVAGPGPTGAPQQVNPAETKLGKLVHVLGAAAQGALAGYGQLNPAAGAQAARDIPFQAVERQQQLRLQQAQTALTQSQSQMVQTPYGPMPAGMAKLIFPAMVRAGATTGAAQIKAQSAENVAQTNKRFQVVPNIGLFDTQTRQLVPNTEQGITITPEIAKDHELPEEFIGKPLTLETLGVLTRGQALENAPVMGAAGPALVNKRTKEITPLGLGSPGVAAAQARPVPVAADPTNPGAITYQSAGQAIGAGSASPQSAPTQAAKAVLKSAVAGPIGNEINANSTAILHADLLLSAANALNNGDQTTLNSLKNRFKNEFGAAGPITAQTVTNAYSREITKMLSSGHMTDAEIASAGGTLDVKRMSPQQMAGVLGAYRALAASKIQMRQQQVERGQQGQPNFPQTGKPNGVPVPTTHTFSVSAWQAANPKGNVNAAKTAAQKQGYSVQP